MAYIFDSLSKIEICSIDIKNCLNVTSQEFDEYSECSACGSGKSPYDILSSSHDDLYSVDLRNPITSITILFHINQKINAKSIWMSSRENVPSNCKWKYPYVFTFEGTNSLQDNQWKVLGSFQDDSLSTPGKLTEFKLNNHYEFYSNYRLHITKWNGIGSWLGVTQFEILGIFPPHCTKHIFLPNLNAIMMIKTCIIASI